MTDAALETLEVATGSQPEAAVIWLHGLGADANDFEPVVDALDLSGLPAIRFVFPHAPVRPITINGGMTMRGWYDITELDFRLRREDEAGIRESARQLIALVARECARGIASQRIVLAGFSQGGAIALHAGLRHAQALGGIIALSTYLPLAASLRAEAAARRTLPLFMAHGRHDPVIPYVVGAGSRELLVQAGYAPQWHEYPIEHGVNNAEIADIGRWLQQVLKADGAPA